MPKVIRYTKGSIPYFEGDIADKVFILLQGEIEVISPKPINQFISGTEYYEEIAKLIDKTKLDKKYDELLNKTMDQL